MFNNSTTSYLNTPLYLQFIESEKKQPLLQLKELIVANESHQLKNLILFIHSYYKKYHSTGVTSDEEAACIEVMRIIEAYSPKSRGEELEKEYVLYGQLIQDIELGIEGTFWEPLSNDPVIHPSIETMKNRRKEIKKQLATFQIQSNERLDSIELREKITSAETSDLKQLSLFIYGLHCKETIPIDEQKASLEVLHKVINYSLKSKNEYRAYMYLLKLLGEVVSQKMDRDLMIKENFTANSFITAKNILYNDVLHSSPLPSIDLIKSKKQWVKAQYCAFDSHSYLSYFSDSLNHLDSLRSMSSNIEKFTKKFNLVVEYARKEINSISQAGTNIDMLTLHNPFSKGIWVGKLDELFKKIHQKLSELASSQDVLSKEGIYYKNTISCLSYTKKNTYLNRGANSARNHTALTFYRISSFCSLERMETYKAHICSTRKLLQKEHSKLQQKLSEAFEALDIPLENLNLIKSLQVNELTSIFEILDEFFYDSKTKSFSTQNFLDRRYAKHLILNYVLMQQKVDELQTKDSQKVKAITAFKEWTKKIKEEVEEKLAKEDAFPINCKFKNSDDIAKEVVSIFREEHGRDIDRYKGLDLKKKKEIEQSLMQQFGLPMKSKKVTSMIDSVNTDGLTGEEKEAIATTMGLQKYKIAVNSRILQALKKEFDLILEKKHLLRIPEIPSNTSSLDLIPMLPHFVEDLSQKFQNLKTTYTIFDTDPIKDKIFHDATEEIKKLILQNIDREPFVKENNNIKDICANFFDIIESVHQFKLLPNPEMLFSKLSETLTQKRENLFSKFNQEGNIWLSNRITVDQIICHLETTVSVANQMIGDLKTSLQEHSSRDLGKYTLKINDLFGNEIDITKSLLKEKMFELIKHNLFSQIESSNNDLLEEMTISRSPSISRLLNLFRLLELEELTDHLKNSLQRSINKRIAEVIQLYSYPSDTTSPSIHKAYLLVKSYDERDSSIRNLILKLDSVRSSTKLEGIFEGFIEQLTQILEQPKDGLDKKISDILSQLGTVNMVSLDSAFRDQYAQISSDLRNSIKKHAYDQFYTLNHMIQNRWLLETLHKKKMNCNLKQIEQFYFREMKVFYTSFVKEKLLDTSFNNDQSSQKNLFLWTVLEKFIDTCHQNEKYQKDHLVLLTQLIDTVLLDNTVEPTELYLSLEKDLVNEIKYFNECIQREVKAKVSPFRVLDTVHQYLPYFFDHFHLPVSAEEQQFLLDSSYGNVAKTVSLVSKFAYGKGEALAKGLIDGIRTCVTSKNVSQLLFDFLFQNELQTAYEDIQRKSNQAEFRDFSEFSKFIQHIPNELKSTSDLKILASGLHALPNISLTISTNITNFERTIAPFIDKFKCPLSQIKKWIEKSEGNLDFCKKISGSFYIAEKNIYELEEIANDQNLLNIIIREERLFQLLLKRPKVPLKASIDSLKNYSVDLRFLYQMLHQRKFPRNKFFDEIVANQEKFKIFLERAEFVAFFLHCNFAEYPVKKIVFKTIFDTSQYNDMKSKLESYGINSLDKLRHLENHYIGRGTGEFISNFNQLDLSTAGRKEEFRYFVYLRYGILFTVFKLLESRQGMIEKVFINTREKRYIVLPTTTYDSDLTSASNLEQKFATAQYASLEMLNVNKLQLTHDIVKNEIRRKLGLKANVAVERGHISFFPGLTQLEDDQVHFLDRKMKLKNLLSVIQVVWNAQENVTTKLEDYLRGNINILFNQILNNEITAENAFEKILLKTRANIHQRQNQFINSSTEYLNATLEPIANRYDLKFKRTAHFVQLEQDAWKVYYDFADKLLTNPGLLESFHNTFNNSPDNGPVQWELIKSDLFGKDTKRLHNSKISKKTEFSRSTIKI